MQVTKRDGRKVKFDSQKIWLAIMKAMANTEQGEDAELATAISQAIESENKDRTVEEIQDMVELKLMGSERKDVAKSYILYREQRNKARGRKTFDLYMDIVNTVSNDITRENANMNTDTPAGMMMKFASETSKAFVDDCLLSEEVREYVKNNYIHIHDKDYYPTKSLTCVQHPLDKILQAGFRAGHGSSRPAKRIETASIIGCIALETIQNEMHGGQAIPAFDFYLAPFVRKTYIEELQKLEELDNRDYSRYYQYAIEDYTEESLKTTKLPLMVQFAVNQTVKRVHQAMEAFIHNMNTIHSRGGNQVVFSSINYGTDTSAEGRCIIREILKATYQGVGNGETPIFPIQIWKLKTGASSEPEDRNYDLLQLACKVTARRFFPNFLNLDAPFNQHEQWRTTDAQRYNFEVATMGCRTRVFENRHGAKTSIGRGNLSFTTINLVKLALECRAIPEEKERLQTFFTKLQKCVEIVTRQLYERYVFQSTALKKQFPLLMSSAWLDCENLAPGDKIATVLKHGTLGIGFIGLAECLIALCGKHHGESPEAQRLGLKIVTFLKYRADHYSKQYDLNFSVLATPAEGLAGKFTRADRAQFGSIPSITDKEFYTNSNHVPVWYRCSVQHKAEVEAPYHALTLGGHIFYVELDGDATHNPEAILQVVEVIKKYNIGYGSVNHTRSRCLSCGYENAEKDLASCPRCGGGDIDTIQRITGYLVGTTSRWNNAKKAELKARVTHKLGGEQHG